MAEKPKNIYQKLLEIQKQIVGLGKDKAAYGYKYVTGDKVLEHLKPLMNQYGLLLKQEVLSIENTRQDYQTKNGTTSEINSKVMMKFTWVDCETGEKDENLFGANGQNAWDKGVGSALTYGERYFLLKYFHIATDEDDIDNPERKPVEAPAQPQKQAPREKAQPQAEAEALDQPCNATQKTEYTKLLNDPTITIEERKSALLKMGKLTLHEMDRKIESLKREITKRTNQQ